MKAPVCSHLILQYVVLDTVFQAKCKISRFFSIDISNTLLPTGSMPNEQQHNREMKDNHVVYLVFHYRYVLVLICEIDWILFFIQRPSINTDQGVGKLLLTHLNVRSFFWFFSPFPLAHSAEDTLILFALLSFKKTPDKHIQSLLYFWRISWLHRLFSLSFNT